MVFQRFIPALAIAFVLLALPAYGQISTPCTSSMITSFTPCLNFITNSTSNGTTPTADCCNALKSFMSTGTGCLCLIATGSVPFQIPINQTLALSLPRACNMPGVPLQCKASAAPIPAPAPAPGPLASGPSISPQASPSPKGSIVPLPLSPTLAPQAETPPTDLTPTTPAVNSGPPTQNEGNRQAVTPSAASTQCFSPFLMLVVFGAAALKYY